MRGNAIVSVAIGEFVRGREDAAKAGVEIMDGTRLNYMKLST